MVNIVHLIWFKSDARISTELSLKKNKENNFMIKWKYQNHPSRVNRNKYTVNVQYNMYQEAI